MSRAAEQDDREDLLPQVQRTVARWTGWKILAGASRFSDRHGQYAFRAGKDGISYLVVAKRQCHEGLASFMELVVKRAIIGDYLLVEFFGVDPRLEDAWVFRPDTVEQHGRLRRGESAKNVDTDWLELRRAEYGVLLGDWLSGREVPPPPEETTDRPVQRGLGEFR